MQLNNPFPNEVRWLYLYDCYTCWQCNGNGTGGNGGIELHHIWGRISASALNSAPLCRACHEKVTNTVEERQRYFKRTMYFLISQHYVLTQYDNDFLELVKNDLVGIVL